MLLSFSSSSSGVTTPEPKWLPVLPIFACKNAAHEQVVKEAEIN